MRNRRKDVSNGPPSLFSDLKRRNEETLLTWRLYTKRSMLIVECNCCHYTIFRVLSITLLTSSFKRLTDAKYADAALPNDDTHFVRTHEAFECASNQPMFVFVVGGTHNFLGTVIERQFCINLYAASYYERLHKSAGNRNPGTKYFTSSQRLCDPTSSAKAPGSQPVFNLL